MDPARFSHDKSPYERPGAKYCCGRGACWQAPCARGPNADGTCGGTSECEPFFDGNGYQCRRPMSAGGPCEQGPGPDGRCGIERPACVPQPSLRKRRGRLTLIAALLAIAAITGLAGNGTWPMLERLDLLDPGPISGAHARFTEEGGCATCHGGRNRQGLAWLGAAFTGHDMSGACLGCHAFDGPPDRPHNAELTPVHGPATLECAACHTEHQGETFNISQMADQQCHSCHRDEHRFTNFGKDHPEFGENFPYNTPGAIKFTHVKHFTKHFPKEGDHRPASETCLSCHDIDHAGPNVPVRSFESMCADCHSDEIPRKDLIVVSLPELDQSLVALTRQEAAAFDPDADETAPLPVEILEACGADFEELERLEALLEELEARAEAKDESDGANGTAALDAFLFERLETELEIETAGEASEDEEGESEEDEEDDFLSIGEDEPTAVDAFLLAIDREDINSYWAPYRSLVHAMTQDGAMALSDLVEARFGKGAAEPLLAGLETLPIEELACAWAGNEEYEPEEEPAAASGWTAEALEIRYKPAGHEDPVVRAWLESALAADGPSASDESAEALREHMFSDKNGPGSCAYCHAPTRESQVRSAGEQAGVWVAFDSRLDWHQQPEVRHQVKYAHGPHINLLGRGSWCTNCHELGQSAAGPETDGKSETQTGGESAPQIEVKSEGPEPVFAGDFKPIAVEKCESCHKESGVRQDCLTCHLYHRSTTFRKRMF